VDVFTYLLIYLLTTTTTTTTTAAAATTTTTTKVVTLHGIILLIHVSTVSTIQDVPTNTYNGSQTV
jgi:hypothetical protein